VFQLQRENKEIEGEVAATVALKHQMPPSLTELIKLEEEARLQAMLCSDYTVLCESRTVRVGLNFCIFVELCSGGELGDWLKNGSSVDFWRLVAQMIAGLVHVHSKFIVHRDLKPENGASHSHVHVMWDAV
jgi:serine/threonine protein kinase